MALITLTEAKLLLGITDTSKDALITALIPIIESDVREYCNKNFQDAPAVPSWEAWMKLPAAQMISYQMVAAGGNAVGMKSESQGGYSYTMQDLEGGYPKGVWQSFHTHGAVMMRTGYQSIKTLYRETRNWTAQELVALDPGQGVDGVPVDED
jgi:hypothetical protein